MQKPKSQTDTQPIKLREGRRASGVVRRPATLLVDSPDATVLFDREGVVLLANLVAIAEGVPTPGPPTARRTPRARSGRTRRGAPAS